MKILIFIDHLGLGGAERVASVLANSFSEDVNNSINITMLIDRREYTINNNNNNVDIQIINYSQNKISRMCMRVKGYTDVINEFKPDIIYALGNVVSIYAALALRFSNRSKETRLITSERTDPSREPKSLIAKKIRNYCYGISDVLVCQTLSAKEYFPEKISRKSVVIPNPISPNLPSWTGSDSKVIISVCRLEKQKNIFMLLNAFKMLHQEFKDYELHIYGEGSLEQEISEYIKNNKLDNKVILKGFSKNVMDKMAGAYMYVSSSDYEGISNAMLEALGIGVPTICTDCPVGGAKMFIDNDVNGILVSVGDVKALYEAMKRLILNPDLGMKFSKKSVKINDELDVRKIADKWIDLIG